MFVVSVTKSAWHAVGERIASFLTAVYHTCSERGEVKLTSRDWRAEPVAEGARTRVGVVVAPGDEGATRVDDVLEGAAGDADLEHARLGTALQAVVVPEGQLRLLGVDRDGG